MKKGAVWIEMSTVDPTLPLGKQVNQRNLESIGLMPRS